MYKRWNIIEILGVVYYIDSRIGSNSFRETGKTKNEETTERFYNKVHATRNRQRERNTDVLRGWRLFTSSGLNIDGDAFSGSSVELHKDGGEGGVDNEGDQEEEGEEAEGAEEDEERSSIEQQLLQERLRLLFVRHIGEQTAVLVSWMLLNDVVVFVVVVVLRCRRRRRGRRCDRRRRPRRATAPRRIWRRRDRTIYGQFMV